MAQDFTITIRPADSILARYGNMVASIADGDLKKVYARALNHEGDKRRTQVKRALASETGINYQMINRGMKTLRAHRNRLEYTLDQKGDETNVGLFKARQGKKGVSAAPWNERRVFPKEPNPPGRKSFFIPGTKIVYIRSAGDDGRYPIHPLSGPNLARELHKDYITKHWDVFPDALVARVGHELRRVLSP